MENRRTRIIIRTAEHEEEEEQQQQQNKKKTGFSKYVVIFLFLDMVPHPVK